jgi:hypothetical protein
MHINVGEPDLFKQADPWEEKRLGYDNPFHSSTALHHN